MMSPALMRVPLGSTSTELTNVPLSEVFHLIARPDWGHAALQWAQGKLCSKRSPIAQSVRHWPSRIVQLLSRGLRSIVQWQREI